MPDPTVEGSGAAEMPENEASAIAGKGRIPSEEWELGLVRRLHSLLMTSPELYSLQTTFEQRADMYKERLVGMATWLAGIQIALWVAPLTTNVVSISAAGAGFNHPWLGLWMIAAGWLFTLYAVLLVRNMNKHINRNEYRAGVILRQHGVDRDGKPVVNGGDLKIRSSSLLPFFQIAFLIANALLFSLFYLALLNGFRRYI